LPSGGQVVQAIFSSGHRALRAAEWPFTLKAGKVANKYTQVLRKSTARPLLAAGAAASAAVMVVTAVSTMTQNPAQAAPAPINLRSAAEFAVLGGQTVTNTGPSILSGDLGVSPGTAVTGFPPGLVNGTTHPGDAVAAQGQTDLTTAYNDASGRAPTASVAGDIGGQTLAPGVYNAASSLGVTGTLTLDGQDDPDAVFIFQIGSTITTASSSEVRLINGARSCQVYWQVGSSATLGTNSTFAGNIFALTSITATTGVRIAGRALARNGAVTLDTNSIAKPNCPPRPPIPTVTVTKTRTITRVVQRPCPKHRHRKHHRHPRLTG
jgi:Ice-binding-like